MKETIIEGLKGINPAIGESQITIELNKYLVQNGYPTLFFTGIFNPNTNAFEGVLMDSENITAGPQLHFSWDWDTNEFTEI